MKFYIFKCLCLVVFKYIKALSLYGLNFPRLSLNTYFPGKEKCHQITFLRIPEKAFSTSSFEVERFPCNYFTLTSCSYHRLQITAEKAMIYL